MNNRTIEVDDATIADLAALMPVPAERELPPERALQMRSALDRAFRDANDAEAGTAPRPRRRRLIRRIGVPAAVLVVAGATAAAILVDDSPARVSFPEAASCSYEYTKTPKFLYAAHIGPGQTPEAACAVYWDAMTDTARTQLPADSPDRTVAHPATPPLVACAQKAGNHDVFVMPQPAGTTPQEACSALGMTRPDESALYGGATVEQVRRLNAMLNGPGLGSTRCMTFAYARARAERALAEVGITTWPIKVGLEPGENPNLAFPVVDADEPAIHLRNGGMTDLCRVGTAGR
ncbi:hypothetical protein [Embleya sp. NPDC005575]|uniref:hypothetical protein n=1 Tax=Embleya sp. NPDC005575 TaxID=3156892 RepID=UPI0033AAA8D1